MITCETFIVDRITDFAIIALNPDLQIAFWNAGAERLLWYESAETFGRTIPFVFTAEDVAAGAVKEEQKKAEAEGRTEMRRWFQRKDGTRFWGNGVMVSQKGAAGAVTGFIMMIFDDTERKRREDEREDLLRSESEARVKAVADNRMKEEFLATLSHELRNSLNSILGCAEILLRSPETQPSNRIHRAAAVIYRNASAQAQLINDLLDLSRLQTGKLALNLVPLSLTEAVTEALETSQDDAAARKISLNLSLPQESLIVDADRVRIQQLVWNLLSNALKFTPEGGDVSVRLEQEGVWARLTVTDSGQGIASEFLPHIFEMFSQADASSSSRSAGMGIGLALVKQFAELHGGRVAAESDGIGLGARFMVRLPLSENRFQGYPRVAPLRLDGKLINLTILVVDNTHDNVETLREMLEMEGATVVAAFSAHEALRAIDHADFDVILCDLFLPQINGYELLPQLRARIANFDTPVIAISGYSRTEDVECAKEAGFAGYLTKPISLNQLVSHVKAASNRLLLFNL